MTQPAEYAPHLFWVWPFAAILLSIAILPLVHGTHHSEGARVKSGAPDLQPHDWGPGSQIPR